MGMNVGTKMGTEMMPQADMGGYGGTRRPTAVGGSYANSNDMNGKLYREVVGTVTEFGTAQVVDGKTVRINKDYATVAYGTEYSIGSEVVRIEKGRETLPARTWSFSY